MINSISMPNPAFGYGRLGTPHTTGLSSPQSSTPWGTRVFAPVGAVSAALVGTAVGADAARKRGRPPRGEPR